MHVFISPMPEAASTSHPEAASPDRQEAGIDTATPSHANTDPQAIAEKCGEMARRIARILAAQIDENGHFPQPDFYGRAFALSLWRQIDAAQFARPIQSVTDALCHDAPATPFHREFVEYALRHAPGLSPAQYRAILRHHRPLAPAVGNWIMLGMANLAPDLSGDLSGKHSANHGHHRLAGRAYRAVLERFFWCDGLFYDRIGRFSAQYHAFCTALLCDFPDAHARIRAASASDEIARMAGQHGIANAIGRGSGQSFGAVCALYALFCHGHHDGAARILARLERAMAQWGHIPLALFARHDLPADPGPANPATPGWYSYNRHYDYLAFAAFWLWRVHTRHATAHSPTQSPAQPQTQPQTQSRTQSPGPNPAPANIHNYPPIPSLPNRPAWQVWGDLARLGMRVMRSILSARPGILAHRHAARPATGHHQSPLLCREGHWYQAQICLTGRAGYDGTAFPTIIAGHDVLFAPCGGEEDGKSLYGPHALPLPAIHLPGPATGDAGEQRTDAGQENMTGNAPSSDPSPDPQFAAWLCNRTARRNGGRRDGEKDTETETAKGTDRVYIHFRLAGWRGIRQITFGDDAICISERIIANTADRAKGPSSLSLFRLLIPAALQWHQPDPCQIALPGLNIRIIADHPLTLADPGQFDSFGPARTLSVSGTWRARLRIEHSGDVPS